MLKVSEQEVNERIILNRKRLEEPYYSVKGVFEGTSDWPGDKEGRALLAFVSHYKIDGYENAGMHEIIKQFRENTNRHCCFGATAENEIYEQQLAGHGWVLRGLCEYFEQFGNRDVLDIMKNIAENLYYPLTGTFNSYPIERSATDGGIDGHSAEKIGRWVLSTDIGTVFISIDGLSHFYKLTHDERAKALLDEMIDTVAKTDLVKLQAQTHCMLAAANGMLRMHKTDGDEKYKTSAEKVLKTYMQFGMTYTYHNFNWWGKGDTWTEPCAVVDSLILALEMFKLTEKPMYRTLAARIYHNAFASIQRSNGGAGTDTTVSDIQHVLKMNTYEAPFCCTMRLAEGLWYVKENSDLLYAEFDNDIKMDEHGRYMNGDLVYAQVSEQARAYENTDLAVERDGRRLAPLLKLYKLNDEAIKSVEQRVILIKQ